MKKTIFLTIFSVLFLSFVQFASADVIINEIMYDLEGSDSGREWVEVYNNGSSINLSDYKFFENNTNHGLVFYEGSETLNSGEYALLVVDPVKFKNDWPNFNGNIFDTSFSLSNDGESLSIKDSNLNINDEYTYSSSSGANGDNNSLQIISGSWESNIPTPGYTNSSSSSDSSSSNSSNDNDSNQNKESSSGSENPTPILKVNLDIPNVVFAGQPVLFNAEVEYGNNKYYSGRYFWNFGDGTSINKINNFKKLKHTYLYPGEYNIILEYYRSKNGFDIPDLVKEMVIKVLPLTVSISKVGNTSDFFVELKNNSNSKIDISNWYLQSNGKTFIFPENTILLSRGTLTLSGRVSGFIYVDQYNLKLIKKDKEIVFDYGASIKPVKLVKKHISSKVSSNTKSNNQIIFEPTQNLNELIGEIAKEDLSATSSVSKGASEIDFIDNKFIYLLIFLVFIASLSVYVLRKDKVGTLDLTEDFEILDE